MTFLFVQYIWFPPILFWSICIWLLLRSNPSGLCFVGLENAGSGSRQVLHCQVILHGKKTYVIYYFMIEVNFADFIGWIWLYAICRHNIVADTWCLVQIQFSRYYNTRSITPSLPVKVIQSPLSIRMCPDRQVLFLYSGNSSAESEWFYMKLNLTTTAEVSNSLGLFKSWWSINIQRLEGVSWSYKVSFCMY
jgi:hypothetical protein